MKYQVVLLPRARRDFAELQDDMRRRVAVALARLEEDPRHPGARRLQARPNYRVRVGDHRIIYEVADRQRVVYVERILPRNERTYDF